MDTVPLDRRISESQSTVINRFADKNNCIFLGRCADYYLRTRNNVIRIWIFNSEENALSCIQDAFGISEKEAAKAIRETNKRRGDYYEYFTSRKWKDPANYDLILNLEKLGIEGALSVMCSILQTEDLGKTQY